MAILTVRAACLNDGALPRHLGSSLRGALGHALMRAHDGGATKANGLYTSIFEPAPAPDSLFANQQAVAPAFVFNCPLRDHEGWRAGQVLSFDWTLLGPAVCAYQALITAMEAALKQGLGLSSKVRFQLDEVTAHTSSAVHPVFSDADPDGPVFTPLPPIHCTLGSAETLAGSVVVEFRSPLQLRAKKRLIEAPTFRDFVRALFMRLEAVAGFGEFDGRPDVRAWLQLAERVEIADQRLERVDYSRFSQRQQRRIPLAGIMGRMHFQGPAGFVSGLLPLAEVAHLGHGTAWGMGAVQARFVAEGNPPYPFSTK